MFIPVANSQQLIGGRPRDDEDIAEKTVEGCRADEHPDPFELHRDGSKHKTFRV